MPESTIADTEMVLYHLNPDGPIDPGTVPQWRVVSGQGTLLSDPAHADWDATLPEGWQMFLVSPTLATSTPGPVDTVYEVTADVQLDAGVTPWSEQVTVHTINTLTSLGLTPGVPVAKP